MARLKDWCGVLFSVLLGVFLAFHFADCQYYIGGSRPIYVINDDPLSAEVPQEPNHQVVQDDVLRARSGLDLSSSEEESSNEPIRSERRRGPVLPPGFDESVRKNFAKPHRHPVALRGDPARHDEDDDPDDRKPESRILWPFSIEISKGKGKGGWGPGHGHGSFGPPSPPQHEAPPLFDRHEYDPDEDPEIQAIRLELYRMKKRKKKWRKIVKYNMAEVGAQLITKAITYLDLF